MRVLACTLFVGVALSAATTQAQHLRPEASPEFSGYGYGGPCGHGSACGPFARNPFAHCGCSCNGTHAGGYGCCPKAACDGSIWTASYHGRSHNLHLWDTYCAETARARRCHRDECPLHSYHQQQPSLNYYGGYGPNMHHIQYSSPSMVPYPAPAPTDSHQHDPSDKSPMEPGDSPLDDRLGGQPLISPDAIELSPVDDAPANPLFNPSERVERVPDSAPELQFEKAGSNAS